MLRKFQLLVWKKASSYDQTPLIEMGFLDPESLNFAVIRKLDNWPHQAVEVRTKDDKTFYLAHSMEEFEAIVFGKTAPVDMSGPSISAVGGTLMIVSPVLFADWLIDFIEDENHTPVMADLIEYATSMGLWFETPSLTYFAQMSEDLRTITLRGK